jgi:hypothetical protein
VKATEKLMKIAPTADGRGSIPDSFPIRWIVLTYMNRQESAC